MNDVRQRDAFDESASIYHSARPRYPAAANSWHWLDRDTRWSKAADLLDDGGHLAIFGASHASDWPPPPPRVGDPRHVVEGEASGRLRLARQRLYVWALDYDADSYLDLLSTFSNHIRMDPAKRDHLDEEVRRRISDPTTGRITRHWQARLTLFQRV